MYPNPYTLHQYTPSTAFMPNCINGWSCPFPNYRSELRALLVVLLLPDFCHFFWGSHLVQNGGVGGHCIDPLKYEFSGDFINMDILYEFKAYVQYISL